MENILEITNLTKYYGKVLGVQDLNLNLTKGEVFGFIGPNGAGKSTTIRSILGILNKTEGKVLFNGNELVKDDIEMKKLIGYLPSEINLYDDFTVKEMLDFHEKMFNKNLKERRQELVHRLKLDESKRIEDLSLGNLKKLGIVLAFMHEPELIILDEPTSGLDPIIQQEFYQILEEEKQKGTTILYSSHILSEVSKICDRVGIIKNGHLLKVEPVSEIIEKSLSFVTITSKEVKAIIDELHIDVITKTDDTVTFKNTINANELLKTLTKYNIEKIYIEPATLEDIFLHYYE